MTPDECRVRARECNKLAATALSPQTRDAMLEAAAMWRRLAGDNDSLATESLLDRSFPARDESARENGSITETVEEKS